MSSSMSSSGPRRAPDLSAWRSTAMAAVASGASAEAISHQEGGRAEEMNK